MKNLTRVSKFLSLVLRHKPQEIGILLDANGWANIDELIEKSRSKGIYLTFDTIEEVVLTNDKQRFALSDDCCRIRANQGHSVSVDLQLLKTEPPAFLYHGTVDKFIDSIKKSGLQKMSRQHVHLSKDHETAHKVGSRRGAPVILKINAGQMHNDGYAFYCSENGVWLCHDVPVKYIEFTA